MDKIEIALRKLNLTLSELREKYTYITPAFLKLVNIGQPEHKSRCICGTKINRNYYLMNIPMCADDPNKILVLGSCCIRNYTKNGTKKTCLLCKRPFRGKHAVLCQICEHLGCVKCFKSTGCYSQIPSYCDECFKK